MLNKYFLVDSFNRVIKTQGSEDLKKNKMLLNAECQMFHGRKRRERPRRNSLVFPSLSVVILKKVGSGEWRGLTSVLRHEGIQLGETRPWVDGQLEESGGTREDLP